MTTPDPNGSLTCQDTLRHPSEGLLWCELAADHDANHRCEVNDGTNYWEPIEWSAT